jgi:hypothetical protein
LWLILLVRVANLLRRWLYGVTAQLPQGEPATPPSPAVQRPAVDPRRPAPPDHWVELVQQYAPHLLDPARSASAGETESWVAPEFADQPLQLNESQHVIDYRAPDGRNAPPAAVPQTNVRPAPLQPSAPRPVAVAQRRSASKRPLRLDQVSTRSLEAEAAASYSAQPDAEPVDPPGVTTTMNEAEPEAVEWRPFAAEQIVPPLVNTTIRPVEMADALPPSPSPVIPKQQRRVSRLLAALHLRRHKQAPTPTLPVDVEVTRREREALNLGSRRPVDTPFQSVRAIPTQASIREAPQTHFTQLYIEHQRIREIETSIPNSATVPTIRTGAGQALRLHQKRTSAPTRPSTPAQTVLRPTLPSLNLDDISADRWPSLPDDPAESPRDSSAERRRRERLKREQEGGTWSE